METVDADEFTTREPHVVITDVRLRQHPLDATAEMSIDNLQPATYAQNLKLSA